MTTDATRRALNADDSVIELRGVGPARAEMLSKAGIETVLDLVMWLPRAYEDRRRITPLGELRSEGRFTVTGVLENVGTVRLHRRRMTLVRATLNAHDGRLPVTWFNRPYLAGQIRPEVEYRLHGKVRRRGEGLELLNPSVENNRDGEHGAAIVPIYPAIAGLGGTLVRRLVRAAIDRGVLDEMNEPLPRDLLDRHGLPALGKALSEIHRPPPTSHFDDFSAADSPAHRRLVYGELLGLQVELALARRGIRALAKRHCYVDAPAVRERLSGGLPFRLTRAQSTVLDEIFGDLESRSPMMRLLQGDVGSGKTVVAGIAMAAAAESGLQAALMAPTELLAEQHYRSLRALLGDRTDLRLLTSSAATPAIREDLRSGRARLCVGTHALMQRSVEFASLGLVVVDEQHRFGVAQRRDLVAKGNRPDLLVMTATPIPRSLAMTVYGDLAVSVIDELPPGRRPVETRVEPAQNRGAVYRWLSAELEHGHKAFVVLPLIEESDKVAAGAVEGLGRKVARRLEAYRPTILHGRLDSQAKARLMAEFAEGESQVLIATTLIEVGVDVPEATAMIIESAERFGLAQLHQLRGRVGRGVDRSTCVAVHGRLSAEARQRLQTFRATADGFELAEADLELRGPGDLLGTRQAGVPNLRLVDLIKHRHWIEAARRDARSLVANSSAAASPFLTDLATRASAQTHLAGG